MIRNWGKRLIVLAASLGMAGFGLMTAGASTAMAAGPYPNAVIYSGQGLTADGSGGYDLGTETCGVANGAEVDGPYLLWVLTAPRATHADITGPWGTAAMTKYGNGAFKYVSDFYNLSTLPDGVTATYDGTAKNVQLTISHGCQPAQNLWYWEIDNGNFGLADGGVWWWTLQNAGPFTGTYKNYGYADAGVLMDLGPLSSLPSSGITFTGTGDIKANIWISDGSMAYTPGYYSSVNFSYGFESASGSGSFWMQTGPLPGQQSVANLQSYYAGQGSDPEVYAWVGAVYTGGISPASVSVSSVNGNPVTNGNVSITPSGDLSTVTVDIH